MLENVARVARVLRRAHGSEGGSWSKRRHARSADAVAAGHVIGRKRNMKQTETIPETFLGVGYVSDRAGLPLDFREGRRAFMEKRKPHFRGR